MRPLVHGLAELFSYIDARDVAQSCEDALTADVTGAHAVIIAADDIILDLPAAEALAVIHPGLAVPEGHGENESLFSNQRARDLIGFAPRWSWRDVLG